eukprot:scaffold278662_cov55-Attheya_sp.AAC.2
MARLLILGDLELGVFTLDAKIMPANIAWNVCYKYDPAFKLVEYEQFWARLNDHWRQVCDKKSSQHLKRKLFSMIRCFIHDLTTIHMVNHFSIYPMPKTFEG